MRWLAVILVALGPALAHATVWDDAIARGAPDPARDTYEKEMAEGDEHALLASVRGASAREVIHQVQLAAASYRAAAAARPDAGEPYFRLGRLLYSFYLECNESISPMMRSPLCHQRGFDRRRAEEVIEAWDAFEARSPLDPRLGVSAFGDNEILFRRALLHTRLATRAHFEGAAGDYEKILARQDLGGEGVNESVVGNLAETYMMLGRLEGALDLYKIALRGAANTSTWYGYAVALDRDERTEAALDVIRSLGRDQREQFYLHVARGDTFFVPEGEKYYYFALADEALGFEDDAIANWRRYIASGAHPLYQPRAKAHLEALLARKKKLPFEPPWQGLLR